MTVHVLASYGARARKPFVSLAIDDRAVVQLPPADAYRIARHLIGAAGAALADAAVIEALGGERLTTEEAASILVRLRTARAAIDKAEGTEED